MWVGKEQNLKTNQHYQQQQQHNVLNSLYFLEDVSVSFGPVRALKSINLSIAKGEKIFLTGPSGAGKTTLLKVLAGLIRPDVGRLRGPGQGRKGQDFVSLIFQDLRLVNEWTAEENLWLAYDPELYKKKSHFQEDLLRLAKMFGVHERLQVRANHLNGGARQKFAIIRSLLTRPSVLLADEPTSALDRDNTFKLYEILNYYTDKKGLTLVWASHNRELVKQFSGRIIHLEEGRTIHVGHACFI